MTTTTPAFSRDEAIALIVKGATSSIDLRFDADPRATAELVAMGRLCGVTVNHDRTAPQASAKPISDCTPQRGRQFILFIDHDPFARHALLAYAEAVRATNPSLADHLVNMCHTGASTTPF